MQSVPPADGQDRHVRIALQVKPASHWVNVGHRTADGVTEIRLEALEEFISMATAQKVHNAQDSADLAAVRMSITRRIMEQASK